MIIAFATLVQCANCEVGSLQPWVDSSNLRWDYRTDGQNACICGCYDQNTMGLPSGTIVIPSTLGDCPVVDFGQIFQGCVDLTSVTIPSTVTNISCFAFSGCSSLTSVKVPNNVICIGSKAFENCIKLTDIDLGNGVAHISSDAFEGCAVSSIHVPSSVADLGQIPFAHAHSLREISVDENSSMYSSDNGLLYDKEYSKLVRVPEGSDEFLVGSRIPVFIADYAFYHCSLLEEIEIPKTIRFIGSHSFEACENLCRMSLPEGLLNIGHSSFSECSNLKESNVPNTVTNIGGSAFCHCGLTNVTIGTSVVNIRTCAFKGCPITTVTIPTNVTVIESQAFADCPLSRIIVGAGDSDRIRGLLLDSGHNVSMIQFIDAARCYEISLDAQGGFCLVDKITIASGSAYQGLPSPTREGYSFLGWFTDAEGGRRVENGDAVYYDTTLFARWALGVPHDKSTRQYCLIDLSSGANASSYAVTYLDAAPTGGWPEECKTRILVLRRIKAGSFIMGSNKSDALHRVTLTKSFYIGVFEVTQRQWQLVTGKMPSYFSNSEYYASRPVEMVDYGMIRGSSTGAGWPNSSAVEEDSFVGRLRTRTGLNVDLPTEAQWEYACRAGTNTDYNDGTSNTGETCANMNRVGRYSGNGGSSSDGSCTTSAGTAAVGSYLPNAWGLYDMHGNVWEWCLDRYADSLSYGVDPKGPESGTQRVIRGGGWGSNATYGTSASRSSGWVYSHTYLNNHGLRLSMPMSNSVATVMFNTCGGSASELVREIEYGSVILELPLATKEGCDFIGWFTDSQDGVQVTSNSIIDGDVTLYAHWQSILKTDPIPELPIDATPVEICGALNGSADAKLTENIKDGTTYGQYRQWANKVKAKGGSSPAGAEAVKIAPNAWLSFALGSGTLIETPPTDGDLKVDAFEPATNTGKFDFTVSLQDIEIGSDATVDNLKKVFGLEGGTTLGEGGLSSENVDITFGTPVGGKVKFTAGPNEKNADAKTFFMKVKMSP